MNFFLRAAAGIVEEPLPTEGELLAHIMANFPPDFFLDPEQGIVDSSGNNVTVTQNGAPTLNTSGGLNARGYISLDGSDDALIVDRVNIASYVCVFRHSSGIMIHNVPSFDIGTGDTPKFFRQGFRSAGTPSRYEFLGNSVPLITSELSPDGGWKSFVCSGSGYCFNNGQSCFRINGSTSSATTVSKMFYGCWGRGDGTSLANFTAVDLGLSMIWSTQLTDSQLYIVHAYLEKRFDCYANRTYQYKPVELELNENNPIFDGNVNSQDTKDQSYPARGIKVESQWSAVYKQLNQTLGGSSSTDGVNWVDEPIVLANGVNFEDFDYQGDKLGVLLFNGSTYTIVYTGENSDGEWQVGYATSSSPLSGYSKSPSNPIVTVSNVNAALGKTYTQLLLSEVVRVNGVWHIFVNAAGPGTGNIEPNDVVLCRGETLDTIDTYNIVATIFDSPLKPDVAGYNTARDGSGLPFNCSWIELSGIIRVGSQYQAFFTAGKRELLTQNRSKLIFPAISQDLLSWKCLGTFILDTGEDNSWNEVQTYWGSLLKQNDDKWLTPMTVDDKWVVFFAGASQADGPASHGQSGIAYAPKKIIETVI